MKTFPTFTPNPILQGNTKAIIPQLQALLGKAFVLTSPEALLAYGCDACTLVKAHAHVVVLPKTAQQVASVVALCRQAGVPYVARGAGTGLSGGALPLEGGVLIGLARLNQLLSLDPDRRTAVVEVGLINAMLNQLASPHHLFYAPDPSSQSACTLGGNIAENAGGIHCLQYGVTTDHVLDLEVVLPSGDLLWLSGHPKGLHTRRTQGLNLIGLMVGSEGTLGIVTKAIVQLLPKPAYTLVVLATFSQLAHATQAVSAIITSAILPSALELMDGFTVTAVNAAYNIGFPEDSEALLLIELAGNQASVTDRQAHLLTLLQTYNSTQTQVATSPADRDALWKARKGAVAAYGRIAPAFYLHDCVIPRSQLTTVLAQLALIAKRYQLPLGNVFHAGDGNLHPHLFFDPDDPDAVSRVLMAGDEILQTCLDAGGVLSGEHGIGIEKSHFMPQQFNPTDLAVMYRIKQVFDPERLANPGKILPQPKGCGETRKAITPQQLASMATIHGTPWV
jgi:glycolate oxidase subunit GlcD